MLAKAAEMSYGLAMPLSEQRPTALAQQSATFATTHWSVVVTAGQPDSPEAAAALEKLCRTYWFPLYAYVRRRGYSEHDGQDVTQGFFAHLFEHRSLNRVDREKGRFRSFLLASLNYFLADQWDRASAQKRGGGREIFSLDAQQAEERYRLEPADERSPDKLFERRWAMTLLDQVLARLAQEFSDAGKSELFNRLRPFLVEGTGEKTYAETAREGGTTEEALKKAVQRMRRRYHQLFREEIAQTVASPDEVEEELRHLCAVLSS
jgi:DNA-directed RNA polymerase specialized sigma24 family protein